ncbi:MAG: glycosyltransferase [Candidatus Altiarchaeota archaeon]|nr:glycosyltransferase [Candidatus Altiarchaeota archaeon]
MISIVIPTLNEEDNIRRLIPEILRVFSGSDIEIVVVDGNSTDGTQDTVSSFSKKHNFIRLVVQAGKGFANAVAEGIEAAEGDIIVTMDAENHMPSEIPKLIDALVGNGCDAVIGSRFVKGADVDLEQKRLLSSKIANKLAKVGLKLKVKDCSSGFRAYRARPVKQAAKNLRTKYFSVQVEIVERLTKAGCCLCEIPVHYIRRDSGDSKFRFKSAVKDATTLVRIAGDNEIESLRRTTRKLKSAVSGRPRRLRQAIKKIRGR